MTTSTDMASNMSSSCRMRHDGGDQPILAPTRLRNQHLATSSPPTSATVASSRHSLRQSHSPRIRSPYEVHSFTRDALLPLNFPTTKTAAMTMDDSTAAAKDGISKNTARQIKKKPQNHNKKKKKKRRRPDAKSRQELEEEWKQERYDKMVYAARKDLLKNAKLVRSFECQKVIRKIKEQQADDDKDQHSNIKRNETELGHWKAMPLDCIVQQSIKQLGLEHLNPNWEQRDAKTDETSSDHAAAEEFMPKIKKVLRHKKMEKCLEGWNAKIIEYRRWCLSMLEKYERTDAEADAKGNAQKKKRRGDGAADSSVREALTSNSSLFFSLGGDDMNDANEVGLDENGDPLPEAPTKKNRPGQRARKARAMALQAKKEGKPYEPVDWRTAKEEMEKTRKKDPKRISTDHHHHPGGSASGNGNNRSSSQQQNAAAESRAESKDAAQAHPSWAAKQSQQSGIVAFKGKKITFD